MLNGRTQVTAGVVELPANACTVNPSTVVANPVQFTFTAPVLEFPTEVGAPGVAGRAAATGAIAPLPPEREVCVCAGIVNPELGFTIMPLNDRDCRSVSGGSTQVTCAELEMAVKGCDAIDNVFVLPAFAELFS